MDDSQHNDDSRPAVPAGEYYASSAFDSRHIPDLEPAVYEQDTRIWPPQSLPWERRPDPAKLRRCIAFGVEGVAPEKSANMMCDGRLLRFVMPSTRLHPVFLFMAQLCGAFLIGIVIYYACGGLHLNWLWLLGGLLLLATLGSLLLHTDLVLTFDRKTGLVSEGEGEPSPRNTVLFYECDPYIVSVQGKKDARSSTGWVSGPARRPACPNRGSCIRLTIPKTSMSCGILFRCIWIRRAPCPTFPLWSSIAVRTRAPRSTISDITETRNTGAGRLRKNGPCSMKRP